MVKMENALQTRKQIAEQCWQQIRDLLPLLDKAQRFEPKDSLMFWGKEQSWLPPWSDSEKRKMGKLRNRYAHMGWEVDARGFTKLDNTWKDRNKKERYKDMSLEEVIDLRNEMVKLLTRQWYLKFYLTCSHCNVVAEHPDKLSCGHIAYPENFDDHPHTTVESEIWLGPSEADRPDFSLGIARMLLQPAFERSREMTQSTDRTGLDNPIGGAELKGGRIVRGHVRFPLDIVRQ
jgi:hypothetical protein